MKFNFKVAEVSKDIALNMVKKYHYSNTLPKINKVYLGFYLEDEIVGLLTLGYGTRPLHTIKNIFPTLEVKNYLEIGRMCMTEEMPKNSESQMISQTVTWLKNNMKDVKVLFTWADGFRGKVGYVYQACSFGYIGFITTDAYMMNGTMIHPRKIKKLLVDDYKKETRITVRPTLSQMNQFGIQHYKGKQFKYIKMLCSKVEQKKLISECNIKFLDYPKEMDLSWSMKNKNGKWERSEKPNYITDEIITKEEQVSLFDL